jgi:hypothetical protein
MRDAELLLRYFAFRNKLPEYAGSMKKFLDNITEEYNNSWPNVKSEVNQQTKQFESAIKLAFEVFGEEDVFRKWKNGSFSGRFNRAVFDVVIYTFYRSELHKKIERNSKKIKEAFITLSKNHSEFVDSVESTTKSLGATTTRLGLWIKTFNKVIDSNVEIPRLENNRIVTTG